MEPFTKCYHVHCITCFEVQGNINMLIIVMQNSFVTQYLVSLKSMSQWNYWSFFRFSMKNSVFLNRIRTLIFQIFKRSSNCPERIK